MKGRDRRLDRLASCGERVEIRGRLIAAVAREVVAAKRVDHDEDDPLGPLRWLAARGQQEKTRDVARSGHALTHR